MLKIGVKYLPFQVIVEQAIKPLEGILLIVRQ